MKVVYLYGGPCDGSSTTVPEPLPASLRLKARSDDLMDELVGPSVFETVGASCTYHLSYDYGRCAVYVAEPFPTIPPGVNWEGIEELKPPGKLI